MQYFQDSATGAIRGFDDDVVVTPSGSGKSKTYAFKTAAGVVLTTPATLAPCDPPADPDPVAAPVYIPNWLVRQRLAAAGLWDAAVAEMNDAQRLEFATLQDGILPGDDTVIALLTAIGADPAAILALPV